MPLLISDAASAATKITTAFAESTDAAIKLAYALGGPNALTHAQVKNAAAMAAQGDRAGALRVVIDALQQQFGGGFES
jgi:hypothetical protein